MELKREHLWIGGSSLLAGIVLGALFFGRGQPQPIAMSPAPDAKTEQAYRRSGFGDRLMNMERRKNFSDCYKTMLRNGGYDENNPTPKPGTDAADKSGFEGKVTFVFHLGEDGTLIDYDLVDSEIPDKTFIRCVSTAVKGVRFMPPPLGINRYLAYDLMFRSDEAFRKEMEEKRNQPPLALVTATPSGAPPAQPPNSDTSQPPPPAPPPPPPPQPQRK